ncbi:hypothetical protein IFR05_012729 [Cadophora sp. M221]|nr:hypothetical protein IFR05_012729 [Cadophora sp. M221]
MIRLDHESVAPGFNPEPEIGKASSELPHKVVGLAEDSDAVTTVPESTIINHLTTKDIVPIIKQAISAVGLKGRYREAHIVKTRCYYQHGRGYCRMYVLPDYARQLLGSKGTDLMRQLYPAENQTTQSVQRPHGEVAAAGCGSRDTKFDHTGSETEAADTCNTVAKKTRRHLSEAHRATLETAYQRNPKPKKTGNAEMATQLGLEKDVVDKWLQNRRFKSKHITA